MFPSNTSLLCPSAPSFFSGALAASPLPTLSTGQLVFTTNGSPGPCPAHLVTAAWTGRGAMEVTHLSLWSGLPGAPPTGLPFLADPGVPLGRPRLLMGPGLWVVNHRPFPIIRKDTKSGWLMAQEMLTLADPRGEAHALFNLSILSFSWSREPT